MTQKSEQGIKQPPAKCGFRTEAVGSQNICGNMRGALDSLYVSSRDFLHGCIVVSWKVIPFFL